MATATADEAHAADSVYQTPEWETRTRPQRNSLLGRFLPTTGAGTGASTTSAGGGYGQADAITKEHAPGAATTAATDPIATAGAVPGRPTMRQRFDRIVPPQRTYFGRSRRFLLLFILLPLAILLFIILPLAIGLGVGLSHKSGSGSSNLPLPSNTATFTGDLTYYEPGLGACGVTSSSSDDIVSVSHIIFDAASTGSNPNANPLCGQKIRIARASTASRKRGNSSVDVTVVDRCTGCAEADLDVSLGVFTQLADEAEGRVDMSWAWLN